MGATLATFNDMHEKMNIYIFPNHTPNKNSPSVISYKQVLDIFEINEETIELMMLMENSYGFVKIIADNISYAAFQLMQKLSQNYLLIYKDNLIFGIPNPKSLLLLLMNLEEQRIYHAMYDLPPLHSYLFEEVGRIIYPNTLSIKEKHPDNVFTQLLKKLPVNELSIMDAQCCDFCQKKFIENFFRCSECKRAYYCNKDCQRAHWKIHKDDYYHASIDHASIDHIIASTCTSTSTSTNTCTNTSTSTSIDTDTDTDTSINTEISTNLDNVDPNLDYSNYM